MPRTQPVSQRTQAAVATSWKQLREYRVHLGTQPMHRLLELTGRRARGRLLARDAVYAHAHDSAAEVQAPSRELGDNLC